MPTTRHEVPGARKEMGISRGGDAAQFTRAPSWKQARPLGPGERARARELARLGQHLKLVEGARA